MNRSPWAVFQGLFVLWVLGMCVGFAVAGQWLLLAAFSAATLVGHGLTLMVGEWLAKRKEK